MAHYSVAHDTLRHQAASTPSQALEGLLDDLAAVLVRMTPDLYTARPAEKVSGSIGEHVRHTLDHIRVFVALGSTTTVSYDCRERGTSVETDPGAALRQIFSLRSAIRQQSARDLDEPVQITALVSSESSVRGWSTRARELAFVVSHTVHHQAIIALLLAFLGLSVPGRFGYAPSTPRV